MKKIILWDHERGSWEYDVFCLLIIAFIFLTPNSWFEKRETLATQSPPATVQTRDVPATGPDRLRNANREAAGNQAK